MPGAGLLTMPNLPHILITLAALAVLVIVFLLAVLLVHIRHRVFGFRPEPGLSYAIMAAWRYVSGLHWTGEPQVTIDGKALSKDGRVNAFYVKHRSRWTRARIRCTRLATPLSFLLGFAELRDVFYVAALALAVHRSRRAHRAIQERRAQAALHRAWVQPLHLAAHDLCGHPRSLPPRDWITLEPDRSEVELRLPPGFNGTERHKERLVEVASAKLALEAPEPVWQLEGAAPSLVLKNSSAPPDEVLLPQIIPAIESSGEHALILGLGKGSELVEVNLHTDSPHLGASTGSGGGKSSTGRIIACQVLHKGGLLLVLDTKFLSQRWARNLPNVRQYHTIQGIHEALIWLGGELDRRNQVGYWTSDIEGNVAGNVGPRLLIMGEELNATMGELKKYWAKIRTSSDPRQSPALDAWDRLFHTGRQARMHVLAIGQRLSVRAMGGNGDARESVGIRLLARYQPATWAMLAGEFAMPPAPTDPGRMQVVAGGRVRETQIAYATGQEAADFSMSGEVGIFPSDAPDATVPQLPYIEGETPGQAGCTVALEPLPVAPSGAVTLADACKIGALPVSHAAAKSLRHRHADFPEPVDYRGTAALYIPEVLSAWYANEKEKEKVTA